MYQSLFLLLVSVLSVLVFRDVEPKDFETLYESTRNTCIRKAGIKIKNDKNNQKYLASLPNAKCIDKCAQEMLNLRVKSSSKNVMNSSSLALLRRESDRLIFANCFATNINNEPCLHANAVYLCLSAKIFSKVSDYIDECSKIYNFTLKETLVLQYRIKFAIRTLMKNDKNACIVRCLLLKSGFINANNDLIINTNYVDGPVPVRQNVILDEVSQMCHNINVQEDECIRVVRRLDCMFANLIEQAYYPT